jgi:Flp pilus assembly protein TadD/TolB-like protein
MIRSLLFLAALALPLCSPAQETVPPRFHQMLLIIPFENTSNVPGIDWISEAFPEVLSSRLNAGSLFVISRDDRLSAFDRLGIPAGAKPSRATIYQVAQELDADYVLMGDYRFDGTTFTVHARVMDLEHLRLSPELAESGPLPSLINMQTALAWDVLNAMKLSGTVAKEKYVSQFAPVRLDALENYVRGILAPNAQEKIKRFKEAVRLEPSHSLAMLQLGKNYYAVRDYESAMGTLSKIPKTDPSSNEAQFYLGLAAFYSGQMDKADAAFRALASRLPLIEVFNNLGVVAARRGDKRARGYFEKSVQNDPNDADYRFNLAIELYREGDVPGATQELRELLGIHPDTEARGFLDQIGSGSQPPRLPLERIKRNYDESSFRQVALEIENRNETRLQKTDPVSHAAFHVQRGQELLENGVLGEAEKQFREAVLLDPTNADAHSGLARVLESNQDFAAARNEARTSLHLKPSPDAYLVLARLDLVEKKSATAAQNVDHALALDPANAAAVALKHDIAAGVAGKPQQPQP